MWIVIRNCTIKSSSKIESVFVVNVCIIWKSLIESFWLFIDTLSLMMLEYLFYTILVISEDIRSLKNPLKCHWKISRRITQGSLQTNLTSNSSFSFQGFNLNPDILRKKLRTFRCNLILDLKIRSSNQISFKCIHCCTKKNWIFCLDHLEFKI